MFAAKLDSLKKVALHPVSEENQLGFYTNMGDNEIVEPFKTSEENRGILGCTADQVELQIANLSDPPGTNAATIVLHAQREKHSEISEDIIGIVALLGAVETEELNRSALPTLIYVYHMFGAFGFNEGVYYFCAVS